MSQTGQLDSARYEAVVLLFKHSAGAQGDIVPDKDGSLILAGVARRLSGNIAFEVSK